MTNRPSPITYLRQDFSIMLPVPNAAPWPELQRFDFVTRTRTLKDDELQPYKDKFDRPSPEFVPPNHQAALAALRQLTGKDAGLDTAAWRQLVRVSE